MKAVVFLNFVLLVVLVLKTWGVVAFPELLGIRKQPLKKLGHGGQIILRAGSRDVRIPGSLEGGIVFLSGDVVLAFFDSEGMLVRPDSMKLRRFVDENGTERFVRRRDSAS